ncbi:winged helix-turn-helix transcriptional regulator [Streptomyces sp. NPDC086777]|uniref:winged helix-turn-helix transcriptional regulator n=1 Tax=Streptomyces sp. NPDC086777 TaxID=3154866 RepID=UPI00344BB715
MRYADGGGLTAAGRRHRESVRARLAKLVEHGVLATAPASDGSVYAEYRLTEKGKALRVPLVALRQWGEDHLFDADEGGSASSRDGQRVAGLDMRAQDGRPLGPGDVEVRSFSV